jgi:hypothetical protein
MDITNIYVPESQNEVAATKTQSVTTTLTVSNAELTMLGVVLFLALLSGWRLFSRKRMKRRKANGSS